MSEQTKTNAIWGKISISCGLISIFLLVSGYLAANILQTETVFWIPLLITVFLLTAGVLSGLVGLFVKRTFAGLLINLLTIASGGYALYNFLFMTCCAPPPLVY